MALEGLVHTFLSELALSGSVTTNTGNLNIYDIFLGEVEQVNGLSYGGGRSEFCVSLNC